MFNFIIYKNLYNYTNKSTLLNIYLCKNQNKYMFDLIEVANCMNYSNSRYLINYYVNEKGYIKNNFYFDYYSDYKGLEIIANKSNKTNIKQIMKDIDLALK
jgi:hypothetical protein